MYPVQTATAPELAELARSVAQDEPQPELANEQPVRPAYQRALFREQVVAIPVLRSSEASSTMKPPRPSRPRNARKVHADQQALDFGGPKIRTALEAVIYCDAPVASPIHRALAVALDVSMILMAVGLFVITFQLIGGETVLNKNTIPLFAGVTAVFGFFYHLLFCIADADTPGMQWTQLRLLNFDGQKPDRDQRAFRLLARCLSLLAGGLGLLWAFVDEEKLTWHDHMSRTFPSPFHR
jgi:uncharacterized RDD family membrane protein YckC